MKHVRGFQCSRGNNNVGSVKINTQNNGLGFLHYISCVACSVLRSGDE
jgi:hypothetical protein